MPLKSGSSQSTIGRNIGEMMSAAKKKGKIGNVKIKSPEHAQKVASAIAYKKAGKSKSA